MGHFITAVILFLVNGSLPVVIGISRAKLHVFIILATIILSLPAVSPILAAEQESAKVQKTKAVC